MSLFSQLLKHRSGTEDFFTEIVAFIFSEQNDLLLSWLKTIGVAVPGEITDIRVRTQAVFFAGRPDILIELSCDNGSDVILIESKLGAQEGPDQLKRYASILEDDYPNANRKTLIYITRSYDPKDINLVRGDGTTSQVNFNQTYWYRFYRELEQHFKLHPNETIIQEVIRFMKEHNMDQGNQFSTLDVLTISNLGNTITLMKQVLDGEITNKFKATLGSASITDLCRHPTRFTLEKFFKVTGGTWYCGLGFYFPKESPLDYPTARLHFGASKNLRSTAPGVLEMMLELSQRNNWQKDDLPEWLGVFYGRGIQEFLVTDDHVSMLQAYFMDSIANLAEIMTQYPQLPW